MASKGSHRKWLSWTLVSSLSTLLIGLGCGGVATLDAHSCCMKNPACHRANDVQTDAKKCCQAGKQSRPDAATHIDITLASKILNGADLPSTPFDQLSSDTLFKGPAIFPQEIFKLPQLEIYHLNSALLI